MVSRFSITLLVYLVVSANVLSGQQLRNGPMTGYVDLREACIWAQSDQPGQFKLYYWPVDNSNQTGVSEVAVETKAETSNTAHFILQGLEPGITYSYSFEKPEGRAPARTYQFTTQVLWQFRTDPPDFRMATGSCTFINEPKYDRPGEPYGGDLSIFDTIASKDPDMMLWLGDNIYLREVDFATRSGILHRYDHARSQPGLQTLLSHCPNYAIWDDHDYGPNDSNRSYVHKDWTLEAFEMFWANPSYGLPDVADGNGITTQFAFNDIDFFLLDNRYHRIASDVKMNDSITVLGYDQADWLIEALKFSRAPFKVVAVGTQFLNTAQKFENFSNYARERQYIIDAIKENKIKGVIFLTGDRHCAELSELNLGDGITIYDMTVSPLTSKPYNITEEKNTLRVDSTIVAERNFATIDFTGKMKERKATLTLYDAKGIIKWQKTIEAK